MILKRVVESLVALATLGAGVSHAAMVDLGPAASYSGFIFGNVTGAADVEGRLAVGGDLTTGFDIGYRNPHGSTAPTLVVQGNANLNAGQIYGGPKLNVDTNASIGPAAATWLPADVHYGDVVYGGVLNAPSWRYDQATQNASYIDFAAAYAQLSALSAHLAGLGANGTWSAGSGGLNLVGDGISDLLVFNLGSAELRNITLSNVKAGAHIVINSTRSDVVLAGNLGGDQAASTDGLAGHRDRVLFNLVNADSVQVNTFVNGSVLAVNAAVSGSGHLEGTLVADSLGPRGDGAKLELGYEPFAPSRDEPSAPTTNVPEPRTALLAGFGLLLVAASSRRGRIGRR